MKAKFEDVTRTKMVATKRMLEEVEVIDLDESPQKKPRTDDPDTETSPGNIQSIVNEGDFDVSRNRSERTTLHLASKKGNIVQVKGLLDLGADVNALDVLKRTPLHVAARYGHALLVNELLENGLTTIRCLIDVSKSICVKSLRWRPYAQIPCCLV